MMLGCKGLINLVTFILDSGVMLLVTCTCSSQRGKK